MTPDILHAHLTGNLPENPHPLAQLRIDDVVGLAHLVHQLETHLANTPLFTENDKGGAINPLVEAIGKNRERLRRSMNDLETLFGWNPKSNTGLPDQLAPLMRKTRPITDSLHTQNDDTDKEDE